MPRREVADGSECQQHAQPLKAVWLALFVQPVWEGSRSASLVSLTAVLHFRTAPWMQTLVHGNARFGAASRVLALLGWREALCDMTAHAMAFRCPLQDVVLLDPLHIWYLGAG